MLQAQLQLLTKVALTNKSILNQIFAEEDRQEALLEAERINDESIASIENFRTAMSSMTDSIDTAITSIKGNLLTYEEFTEDEIRRLNLTQRAFESSLSDGDTDKSRELLAEITSLSTNISSSAFGDTSLLDQNLISSLENTKALIDFEDEIVSVYIVGSDLTEPITSNVTTPSVIVDNPTTSDERMSNIEALMTQLLINNREMNDTLLRLKNDGIKTI